MATASLLEDCQTVIEKGHESWKSYFSKWEAFAKYEEDIPENELFSEPKKISNEKKRVKKSIQTKSNKAKLNTPSSVRHKKNQVSQKKLVRRKRIIAECKQKVELLEENSDTNSENLIECVDNNQLETILKRVFTEILKANKNEFQMFTVLSQTVSGDGTNYSQFVHHQQALPFNGFPSPLQLEPVYNSVRSLSPYRSNYIRGINKRWSSFDSYMKPVMKIGEVGNTGLTFSDLKLIHRKPQFLSPLGGNQKETSKINLSITNGCPMLSSSLRQGNTRLKSLEWDSGLKSTSSECRKINTEYFIRRSFPKMSITQDGKRFRNLCLRKRTNSVTLSMENSNFITPERKPPERKCFSENVLQRKRTCPSKLFFGHEEEESESDDETGKQTPIIHCRNKKLKTQVIQEVTESDSDDCESIFDRVKSK